MFSFLLLLSDRIQFALQLYAEAARTPSKTSKCPVAEHGTSSTPYY